MRKMVFVGCHCDDIEIGCGATIFKNHKGWQVDCHILTHLDPTYGDLKDYSTKSLNSLGVSTQKYYDFGIRDLHRNIDRLHNILKEIDQSKPDSVFVQSNDWHVDHSFLNMIAIRTIRNSNLIFYRSSRYNHRVFNPNTFENIPANCVERKIEALRNYPMVKTYLTPEFVRSELTINGVECNFPYAEAFESFRRIKI